MYYYSRHHDDVTGKYACLLRGTLIIIASYERRIVIYKLPLTRTCTAWDKIGATPPLNWLFAVPPERYS